MSYRRAYLEAGARVVGAKIRSNSAGGWTVQLLEGDSYSTGSSLAMKAPVVHLAADGRLIPNEDGIRTYEDVLWVLQPDFSSSVSSQHYIDTGFYTPYSPPEPEPDVVPVDTYSTPPLPATSASDRLAALTDILTQYDAAAAAYKEQETPEGEGAGGKSYERYEDAMVEAAHAFAEVVRTHLAIPVVEIPATLTEEIATVVVKRLGLAKPRDESAMESLCWSLNAGNRINRSVTELVKVAHDAGVVGAWCTWEPELPFLREEPEIVDGGDTL